MAVKASSVAPTIKYPRTCLRTSCAYSSVSCSTGEISGGLFIVREDRRAEKRKSKPDRRSARKGRPLRRSGLRSEEHTSELQSLRHLVCRLLLEKKKQ